jgi:hypothetical protein
VNLSAFAGGSRVLRFEEHNGEVDFINFNLDDVTLNVSNCTTTRGR